MTMTKNNRWPSIGVACAVAALVACDPYEEASDATPAVVRALVADSSFSAAIPPVVIESPAGDGVWRITNVNPADTQLIVVTTNKLLNGASIQASIDDCTPVAANFTFPAGTWSACYYPNSASEDWGSSVIIYNGDPTDATTATLAPATTYTITANITDVQNKPLTFTVEVQTQ